MAAGGSLTRSLEHAFHRHKLHVREPNLEVEQHKHQVLRERERVASAQGFQARTPSAHERSMRTSCPRGGANPQEGDFGHAVRPKGGSA